MNNSKFDPSDLKVPSNKAVSLNNYDPGFCDGYQNKKAAKQQLKNDIKLMSELQYRLYAENKQALLIIFQAMDAAGKDGAIQHVFSGVNPQGCEVHSFKQPCFFFHG